MVLIVSLVFYIMNYNVGPFLMVSKAWSQAQRPTNSMGLNQGVSERKRNWPFDCMRNTWTQRLRCKAVVAIRYCCCGIEVSIVKS